MVIKKLNSIICQNPNCKKELIVKSRGTRKFCSSSCSSLVNNQLRFEKMKEEYLSNPKTCLHCTNAISFDRRKYDFCQPNCTLQYNKKLNNHKQYRIDTKPISSEFEFTRVIRSKITGKYYNKELHKDTWHNNSKYRSAVRLANMFNFELAQSDTLENILNAIQKLSDLYYKEKLSSVEIANKFNLDYSELSVWLNKCLKIALRTLTEANKNFCVKTNRSITDEKQIYYKACNFRFNPYEYKNIPGYELLLERGIYHSVKNPNGVCRDHMISKEFGYRNNICPEIISHPANCQFLDNIDNIKKGSGCCLTLDELKERIKTRNYIKIINNSYIRLPMSDEHKQKISKINKKYCNITNGIDNLRILKTDPIPDGFRRGMSTKKK